jgi:hypothetical protein
LKLFTQKGRNESDSIRDAGALPGAPENRAGAPRRPRARIVDKETVVRRYHRAFTDLLSRQRPTSMTENTEGVDPILDELSPDTKAWTGDVMIRVYMLMQQIAKDLDDPAYARGSLDLLASILSKGGDSALQMARPIFREKIHSMYRDTTYENERFLPRLELLLEGFDTKHVEKLAKEAIHAWGDDRFRAAGDFLGPEELEERGLRKHVKGVLLGEIARAGNAKNLTALSRAVELYQAVK